MDKTLPVGSGGKILHFPIDFFKEYICSGKRCFLCGKILKKSNTNEEHVLPQWLLRKFNLYNKEIVLANGVGYSYSKYKIPCCIVCNRFLGKEVEEPMEKLLSSGYTAVADYIKKNGPWNFIVWLSLIFFKTHYKDLALSFNLDRRKGKGKIADIYDWGSIHHIYTIMRSVYVNAEIDSTALSTFYLVNANTLGREEAFDYNDLHKSRSILFQYNDIVLIALLDDGCGVFSVFIEEISKISGALSPFQVKELYAKISYLKLLLKEQTQFYTEIDEEHPTGIIRGKSPKSITLNGWVFEDFGKIYYRVIKELLESFPEIDQEKHDLIKKGLWSFLYNENGQFVKTN